MFTKKLKKSVKETKKATEDVKKVVRKAKKAEDKKQEVKKEIDHTKDLKEAIDTALKLKGVRGFIVLVDAKTKDEMDKTHGTGLKAICGSGDVLANLIGNIDEEIMNIWKKKEEIRKLMDGGLDDLLKNGSIDDLLKAVIKLSKDN